MKTRKRDLLVDVVKDVAREVTASICTRAFYFVTGYLDGYYGTDYVDALFTYTRQPTKKPAERDLH